MKKQHRVRSSRRHLTVGVALAGSAALLAAGIGAGTAGAAPEAPAGALPASLSAGDYLSLVKSADAPAAKKALAKELKLDAKEGLEVRSVIKNNNGDTHTRYERTYDGLPVIGGDLVVQKTGSGETKRVIKATDAEIAVDTTVAPAAHKPAKAAGKGSSAPRQVVFAMDDEPVLAWERVVGGTQKSGAPSELHVYTDAKTGKKLLEFQAIHEGSGHGLYNGEVELGTSGSDGSFTLTDTERGGSATHDMGNGQSGNGTLFTNDTDIWGDGTTTNPETAAVDAHYGAATTWDYFKNVHGREGIRGDGQGALTRVHYGNNYANAFWSDSCFCMTYGDGLDNERPLTALDVAAHEMTHGVTSATAGLVYSGESGGLNEATSDIFAAAVEFYADNGTDVPDYFVGELIDIRGDGEPLRYMDEPSKDGRSLDYWEPGAGNVDVHYSSGIANHFFFLLAEGSGEREINGVQYNSPTADGSTLEGIGIEKSADIWFKALTEQMTSTTNYAAARTATVAAASDLYGADSAEVAAVEAAWTAVNVQG